MAKPLARSPTLHLLQCVVSMEVIENSVKFTAPERKADALDGLFQEFDRITK
ncbi:MAG: hypothetical protein J0G35_03025 [Acidobacteriales bacterium]|nr:hypothetical protein [Terriglobales bacterium]